MVYAQVVKELRTEYAAAVALAAGRLSDILRASPPTNIKMALTMPMPERPADALLAHARYPPQQQVRP